MSFEFCIFSNFIWSHRIAASLGNCSLHPTRFVRQNTACHATANSQKRISCETSLKIWKWKMWKRSVRARLPFQIHSFNSSQFNSNSRQFNSSEFNNSTQLNSIQFIQVNSFNSFLHSYILGHHKCPQHGSSFKLPLIITPIYIYTHTYGPFFQQTCFYHKQVIPKKEKTTWFSPAHPNIKKGCWGQPPSRWHMMKARTKRRWDFDRWKKTERKVARRKSSRRRVLGGAVPLPSGKLT